MALKSVPGTGKAKAGHIDYVSPLPDMQGKRPLGTLENFRAILQRAGITIRYNEVSKAPEIDIPGQKYLQDNEMNCSLAFIASICNRFRFPLAQIDTYIPIIAEEGAYSPALDWILSTPWDGTDRLDAFVDTITAPAMDPKLKRQLMIKWMISAIVATTEKKGISAHGVLVFQGAQGLGKTYWFKKLVPDLGLTQDGLFLNPQDKDSVFQACSNWIVELGELDATFRKSDISQLKAFLTRERDILRRPYAKTESKLPRRTVFFASVNAPDFLHDESGNRRFWVIPVTGIDYEHKINMQQVWAQIYTEHFIAGATHILSAEQLAELNLSNQSFEAIEPLADLTASDFLWDTDRLHWRWITATAAAGELIGKIPSKIEVSKIKSAILALNGGKFRKYTGIQQILVPNRRPL